MKKIITLLLLLTSYIFSNINTVVSIAPVISFVKAIGGDKVDVSLMVQAGNSPHTYEPKPSQMTAVAKAQLYFAIGVEFEDVWLPKLQSLNTQMKVIDLSQDVEKIEMVHYERHEHEGKDPHIWTSPTNVKRIAQNIYKALSTIDTNNTKYYENNLHTFLAQINTTDMQVKKILSSLKDSRNFMVFHPSWGYFAKTYSLTQVAVEVEGKSPKPRELVHLIQEAKKQSVTAIITQAEFSDSSAKIIAHELHIPVEKLSPMAPNWSENLIKMAKTIAGQR